MSEKFPTAIDFRGVQAPDGFTNLNDLFDLRKVSWLHPVQSLFGNWNGKFLILGQDYNGLSNIEKLSPIELKHDPSFETNKNLIKIFGNGADCLYANFFWFIKNGWAQEKFSTRKEVVDANRLIFHDTVKSMRNLIHIFPMGSIVTAKAFGIKYQPLVTTTCDILGRQFKITPIPHLGARGLGNYSKRIQCSKLDALEKIKKSIIRTIALNDEPEH